MDFYNVSSYLAIAAWLADAGSHIVSSRQVAFLTDATAFTNRFYRQRISETGSGTLVVENALSGSGEVQFKIYWTALIPSSAGILITPLNRKREGHYVFDVGSTPWLKTDSLSPY